MGCCRSFLLLWQYHRSAYTASEIWTRRQGNDEQAFVAGRGAQTTACSHCDTQVRQIRSYLELLDAAVGEGVEVGDFLFEHAGDVLHGDGDVEEIQDVELGDFHLHGAGG